MRKAKLRRSRAGCRCSSQFVLASGFSIDLLDKSTLGKNLGMEDVNWGPVRQDHRERNARLVRRTSRKLYSLFLSTSNPLVYEAWSLVASQQPNYACLVARLTLRLYHLGVFHIRHALVLVYGLSLCGSRGKAVACLMFGNPRKNCTMRFSPSPPPACGLQPCLNALM